MRDLRMTVLKLLRSSERAMWLEITGPEMNALCHGCGELCWVQHENHWFRFGEPQRSGASHLPLDQRAKQGLKTLKDLLKADFILVFF